MSNDELRLRLQGIQACQGGAEDTERFVHLLRWLAQREVEFEPEADSAEAMPQITSKEAGKYLGTDDHDDVALRRLYAMLQLDHWGLNGGGGSNTDGWFVSIGPDIWRFRNVGTIDNCIQAREHWVAEEKAAIQPMSTTTPPHYYHVRVSTKSRPSWDEVRLDLSRDELESRFVTPYRESRPIVINGTTIPIDDLAKLRINRTEQPSAELRPTVKAEERARRVIAPIPEDWRVADKGEDVTDQFITEPPGTSASLPTTPQSPAAYVDGRIVYAIRTKEGKTRLNDTKLLKLIEELNDNYTRDNSYAAHALLRAILDHIPPILGYGTFNEVANNYPWSRTDRAYIKRLLEFRRQADDVLHRPISRKSDLLGLDDMPPVRGSTGYFKSVRKNCNYICWPCASLFAAATASGSGSLTCSTRTWWSSKAGP